MPEMTKAESSDSERPTHIGGSFLLCLGYGLACGLVFPLMVSSTYLKTVSLSHGAGNAFGLFFFIAYSVAMLIASCRIRVASNKVVRFAAPLGLFLAFLGNLLMLLRLLAGWKATWVYVLFASGSIGCGLALAELGWVALLSGLIVSTQGTHRQLLNLLSLSFIVSGAAALVIFGSPGAIELVFAIAASAGSALVFLVLGTSHTNSALSTTDTGHAPAQPATGTDSSKALVYVAVFSFVFGAYSQASLANADGPMPIELQSIVGLLAASLLVLILAATPFARRATMPDLYVVLLPLVALALVAAPFVTSASFHTVSTLMIFAAYFTVAINARAAACQASGGAPVAAAACLGRLLGVGSLCIIAGTLFGSFSLKDSDFTGYALVSLVSLFVIAVLPTLIHRIKEQTTNGDEASEIPDTELEVFSRQGVEGLASQLCLTSREEQTLGLIIQGRTRDYIARELGLSPNTVKGYIHSIYQKAGVSGKQELIDLVQKTR